MHVSVRVLLLGPRVLDRLAVARGVGAKREQPGAIRSGLECPRGRRRHPYRVERNHVEELPVELHPPAPAQDDVDLLGVDMPVRERAALAGAQAKVRDAGALGGQRLARDPRFPAVAEPVRRGRIVDRDEIHPREGLRHYWWPAPLPLMRSAEATSAAVKSTMVTFRRRAAVSHAKWRFPSQARVPFAAAMLLIAVSMHCMHMLWKILVSRGWPVRRTVPGPAEDVRDGTRLRRVRGASAAPPIRATAGHAASRRGPCAGLGGRGARFCDGRRARDPLAKWRRGQVARADPGTGRAVDRSHRRGLVS